MKILIVHNRYHLKGGEDRVFEEETRMLREHEHRVELYEEDSGKISGGLRTLLVAINLVFSLGTYLRISRVLKEFQPDVVHVHNYFPIISPSVFYACSRRGVPVVHSLHNYRAICPTGLLMHKGKIDERSIAQGPFWAVRDRVYRNSALGTFILAFSIYIHRAIGTWRRKVDRYIALTEFQKRKFVEAGWPAEKIAIKPNFAEDHYTPVSGKRGGFCLFVGRLSQEKGVTDLLQAWKGIDYPLKIVGEGPLLEQVVRCANPQVEALGSLPKDEVYQLMAAADLLILTSRCYEAFGLVLVEAFSRATPVVAPNLGGIPEIVEDGTSGVLYEPGDEKDLRAQVTRLIHQPEQLRKLGEGARAKFESYYTQQKNYQELINIYRDLLVSIGKPVIEEGRNEV